MHLQRIQVPDFRVLKDVDITFEKEFVPSIFPLGSLNGGGKSTLLQLIFVLLHCSTNPSKTIFVRNMLDGFKIHENASTRVLAIADIWDGDRSIKLDFFSYKDSYIRKILNQDSSDGEAINENPETDEDKYLYFSTLEKTLEVYHKIKAKEREITEKNNNLQNPFHRKEVILKELELAQYELNELQIEYTKLVFYSQKILQCLRAEKLIYICSYSVNENEHKNEFLLCQIDNVEIDQVEAFLEKLSQKVFLAAPATQIFLFLSKESRKLLFINTSLDENNDNNYYSEVKKAKSKLSGFFAYDFLAVELLMESFKAARDRDFREAIETGEYGNNYKELKNELNRILSNKQINLNVDLSGFNFKLVRDEGSIKLNPEDLSHGELKRLSIYQWIKFYNIENAIVLMDEVEIAFHPDWQYQIISDLQQWAPSNQYILATHSYELCQALTPSHVKELEPKLLKQEAQQ